MRAVTRSGSEGIYDESGRRKYLTKNEGLRFLHAAGDLEQTKRLLCLTIFYTGCRPSEAIRLTRSDLDSEAQVLRILCLKKREKHVVRRVPIPPWLVEELSKLECHSESGRFWPICRSTGWRIVKAVMRTAGIEGIHACPKGLRHGFGIRGASNRIPVSQIQKWMGHSHSETTAIYLDFMGIEEVELIKRTWEGT